ncbi:MAG: polymerase subunit epsilon [Actinomycetota bacterium]|nr:polymerase subunit epsilon [Actinomycetota bacterium]
MTAGLSPAGARGEPRGRTADGLRPVLQPALDGLDPRPSPPDGPPLPLHDVTFVIVDLETTGGSPHSSGITEIGAVKVRAGRTLGEFQTLVNPGGPIPPFIAVLTGITDAMVASAPPVCQVLPEFLDFAAGTVLVAHNAPFDIGFLQAACEATGHPWPAHDVVDTVRLARQLVGKHEARNRKLATLARLFGARTTPEHRALADARATVDVLHALLERIGSHGVTTLPELLAFRTKISPAVLRKRRLADDLPHSPGVYLFRDADGRVLYVGTSVDIRTRVSTYFTGAEQRSRMARMVTRAEAVTCVVCTTPLEARVRELRLIAELTPHYNRRSRQPDRAPWVKLTAEPFPRLSVVRAVRADGAAHLGPFGTTAQAEQAIAALQDAFGLRRCSGRLSRKPAQVPCAQGEMGRCGAPCLGGEQAQGYAGTVERAALAMTSDVSEVVSACLARAAELSRQEKFEQAAVHRDRLLAFLRAARRRDRTAPLAALPELLAALPRPGGGWELVLVRYGRFAGTTLVPPGAAVDEYLRALRATGEHVEPAIPPSPAAHPEETEQVAAWLEQDGVRLVSVEGRWSCPIRGAGWARALLDPEQADPDRLASTWDPPFHAPLTDPDTPDVVLEIPESDRF